MVESPPNSPCCCGREERFTSAGSADASDHEWDNSTGRVCIFDGIAKGIPVGVDPPSQPDWIALQQDTDQLRTAQDDIHTGFGRHRQTPRWPTRALLPRSCRLVGAPIHCPQTNACVNVGTDPDPLRQQPITSRSATSDTPIPPAR